MRSEVIHGDSVFEQLANEWNALSRQSATDTPFQHLAYQRAWWQHLQPPGATLHTVALRDAAGALAGLACLYNLDGTLYFNGCVEETDYLDVIAAPEHAKATWTAVFQTLCADTLPSWHAISLCNVPQASPSRQIVPRLAAQHGLTFAESIHEVCPVIPLPDSFDAYLDSID
ncbi:MAG: hypothetical protein KC425_10990, partial [Anaerolineales bacterium]|nr:hypothetical protein [Anaerolineales bacterium]